MTLEIENALRSRKALVKILEKVIHFNIASKEATVEISCYTSTASFRALEISVKGVL